MSDDLLLRRARWLGREAAHRNRIGALTPNVAGAANGLATKLEPEAASIEPRMITAGDYLRLVQQDFAVLLEQVRAEVASADNIVDPTHASDIAATLAVLCPALPSAVALLVEAGKHADAASLVHANINELRAADPHLFAADQNAMTVARTQRAVIGGGDLVSLHSSADYAGTEGRRRQLWAARHKLQRRGMPIPPSAPHVTPITRGPDANAN